MARVKNFLQDNYFQDVGILLNRNLKQSESELHQNRENSIQQMCSIRFRASEHPF